MHSVLIHDFMLISLPSFIGVFLRKLESGLRGISHVVIDEIHERDINVSMFYPSDNQNTRSFTSIPYRLARNLFDFNSQCYQI